MLPKTFHHSWSVIQLLLYTAATSAFDWSYLRRWIQSVAGVCHVTALRKDPYPQRLTIVKTPIVSNYLSSRQHHKNSYACKRYFDQENITMWQFSVVFHPHDSIVIPLSHSCTIRRDFLRQDVRLLIHRTVGCWRLINSLVASSRCLVWNIRHEIVSLLSVVVITLNLWLETDLR